MNALRMNDADPGKWGAVSCEISELQNELEGIKVRSFTYLYPCNRRKHRQEVVGKIKRREAWLKVIDAQLV